MHQNQKGILSDYNENQGLFMNYDISQTNYQDQKKLKVIADFVVNQLQNYYDEAESSANAKQKQKKFTLLMCNKRSVFTFSINVIYNWGEKKNNESGRSG